MNSQDIEKLIAQLRYRNPDKPDEQFKAAIKLGEIKDADAQIKVTVGDELIKALGSEQALTRAHAAEALGKLEYQVAIMPLIGVLEDDYQLVRSYAVRALGKMNDPTAIKAIHLLVSILGNDPFFGARAEAAEALGKLCKLCKDDNIEAGIAKTEAEKALESYRSEEEKRLNRKEEEGRSRRVLAEMELALKELGEILDEIDEALDQGRQDHVRSLLGRARKVIRMGYLTSP